MFRIVPMPSKCGRAPLGKFCSASRVFIKNLSPSPSSSLRSRGRIFPPASFINTRSTALSKPFPFSLGPVNGKKKNWKRFATACAALVIGSAIGCSITREPAYALSGNQSYSQTLETDHAVREEVQRILGSSVPRRPAIPLTSDTVADAAEKALPAVVQIEARQHSQERHRYGRRMMSAQANSGTGFIIHESGVVLTNAHVVADHEGFCSELTITMANGESKQGQVVAMSLEADVAILVVESDQPFPTLPLGSSTALKTGDFVIAIGSPVKLEKSVTTGVISAKDRMLDQKNNKYIQTDAAINAGNSGGPLINVHGEVVGINNMTALDQQGISFAIPIDDAKVAAQQLLTAGKFMRPFIGISMLALDPYNQAVLRQRGKLLPNNISSGVLVARVVLGSPADKAGICPGDVIIGINGHHVRKSNDVLCALGNEPGKTSYFNIWSQDSKSQTWKSKMNIPVTSVAQSIDGQVKHQKNSRL